MATSSDSGTHAARQTLLESKLKAHIAAENYFTKSGRTLRKGRFRIWFNRYIKPAVLRVFFALTGLYGRGKRNAIRPIIRRITFEFPDLPFEFDGFEILQISDIHIDRMDGLAEALARIIKPLRPDLCVFTGDYRWEIVGPCDLVYPRLDKVVDSVTARHGIIAILGNHDPAEIAFHLEDRGVPVLVNESFALQQGSGKIWIAGTDDPFDYFCADLNATMADVPKGAFTILLCHSPQLYEGASQRGVQLYLCGHTHAGQVRLPWIGAVKKNVRLPRKFVQSKWTHDSLQGYTSWGAGCSTLPVRYNCPPEVCLIRLKRQS